MLKLLKTIMRAGTATVKYPFAPLEVSPGFRGKPDLMPSQCIACGACACACPANALTIQTDDQQNSRTWQLYLRRCIYCGRCEEVCPTRAIQLTNNFEPTVTNKADSIPARRSIYNVAAVANARLPSKKPSHWLLNCWQSNKMRHKTAKCCGRKRASARSANNARRCSTTIQMYRWWLRSSYESSAYTTCQPAHHAGRANAKDEAAFATGYPSLGLRLSRRLRRLQRL